MMKKKLQINGLTYAQNVHPKNPSQPCLLLLHGFMGDSRVFDHLIEDLSDFCNPVTVDLLGHGMSSKTTEYRSYQDNNQVKDILKLVDSLKASSLFLYGYSMGGRLALKVALEAPELFLGLILESSTCGITDPEKADQRYDLDDDREHDITLDFQKFLKNWKTLELFQSPLPVDEKLVKKYHKIQSQQTPESLSGSLWGFGSGTMKPVCDKLKTFSKPVLLLAGSADKKYQRINRSMARKFPNATFNSIKAGHRIHLDNPLNLITAIQTFIKSPLP